MMKVVVEAKEASMKKRRFNSIEAFDDEQSEWMYTTKNSSITLK